MPDLETLIRERQDQLRGRPLTRLELFRERLGRVDWADVAFLTFGGIAVAFYTFVAIVQAFHLK